MCKSRVLFIFLSMIYVYCSFINAQSNSEIYQGFQFEFYPPSGRSVAMGGAFIGLADDATAAYTNPAGLMILRKPEASFVLRSSQYQIMRPSQSDVFTSGTLAGFESSNVEPHFGFLSFVLPLENFVFSVSISNLYDSLEDFTNQARPLPAPNESTIIQPTIGRAKIWTDYISFSVAAKISDDIYLGLAINRVTLAIELNQKLLMINGNDYTDLSQPVMMELSSTGDYPVEIGFTGGALIYPFDNLSIGAVYSYNPTFSYAEGALNSAGIPFNDINISFNMPDRFGAGIAYRPIDTLVLVTDVVYIMYEQMTENVVASVPTSTINRGDNLSDSFSTPNSTEFRVGAEYSFFIGDVPLYLRAGMYILSDHRTQYTGNDPVMRWSWNISDYATNLDENEIGRSAGIGIVIAGFQIDFSATASQHLDQWTVSVVYHF